MAHLNFWRKSKFSCSLLLPFTLTDTDQIITCAFMFELETIFSFILIFYSSVTFSKVHQYCIFQNLKIHAWLLLSIQTCKELGSHYSCPYNKKGWIHWKAVISWTAENWGNRAKCHPEIWKGKSTVTVQICLPGAEATEAINW